MKVLILLEMVSVLQLGSVEWWDGGCKGVSLVVEVTKINKTSRLGIVRDQGGEAT